MKIFAFLVLGLALMAAQIIPSPAQAVDWDCTNTGPALGASGQPAMVDKPFWKPTFDGQVTLAKLKPPRVVMLGDSQIEWWPGGSWEREIAPIGALNFGMHSDETQNLLWRFENAGPDVWRAPVFVVLIGTNNISLGDSPEMIADGVRVLLNAIKTHAPDAKVIIIGILPRERGVNDWILKAVTQTNAYLQSCQTRPGVSYISFTHLLQNAAGDINDGVGEDKIHLTEIGYERITPPLLAAIKAALPDGK